MSGYMLLLFVVPFLIYLVVTTFRGYVYSGFRKEAPVDDSACAACGSRDLVVEEPGVYTCRACGYAGGSRRGAQESEARAAAWAARPATERVAAARDDLETAHRLLVSIRGDALSMMPDLRVDGDGNPTRNRRLYLAPDQGFRRFQLKIENRFGAVRDCFTGAAEKVPEIEVPEATVLDTGLSRLGEKWDEIRGHVSELEVAVDRAGKILALVPGSAPAPTALPE